MSQDKAIQLGHPSYVWRFGQDRRLNLIRQYAPLEHARVLDVGCGIGTYVEKFRALDAQAYGVDIDLDKLVRAHQTKQLDTVALSVSSPATTRSESCRPSGSSAVSKMNVSPVLCSF